MSASNKKRKVDHKTPVAKATKSVSAGRELASSDPRFKLDGDFWGADVWDSDADVDLAAAAAGPGPGSAKVTKKNRAADAAVGSGWNARTPVAPDKAIVPGSPEDLEGNSDGPNDSGDAHDDVHGEEGDKGLGSREATADGDAERIEGMRAGSADGGTSDFDVPKGGGEGQAADGTEQARKSKKVLSNRTLQRVNEASERRGIVYISRIPPHMKPHKLRQLLEPFGDIGRVYCAPEDPSLRRMRKKQGGNSGKNFTEGWVEFEDKRRAKRAALALNGQPMGGSKRSAYHYDLWNIKYLPKFKWDTLTEEINYQRAVREQRLVAEISAAKRERDFYLSRVDKAKAISAIQERRAKKQDGQQVDGGGVAEAAPHAGGAGAGQIFAAGPDAPAAAAGAGAAKRAAGARFERHFGQRKAKADPVLDSRAPVLADDVLGLFGRKRKAQ